jgi:hypothetical protein
VEAGRSRLLKPDAVQQVLERSQVSITGSADEPAKVGIVVALASWWRWHRGGVADARLPDPAGLVEREQFAARDNRREVDSAVGPVKQARWTRRTGAEWAIPSADPPSCGQERHGVEKEVRTR